MSNAARTRCSRCAGTGVFARCWDVTDAASPRPAQGTPQGVCFRCGGKGFQTSADERRNAAYDRRRIADEAGAMLRGAA